MRASPHMLPLLAERNVLYELDTTGRFGALRRSAGRGRGGLDSPGLADDAILGGERLGSGEI